MPSSPEVTTRSPTCTSSRALHVLEVAAAASSGALDDAARARALHERVDAAVVVGEQEHARARAGSRWTTCADDALRREHRPCPAATPSRSPGRWSSVREPGRVASPPITARRRRACAGQRLRGSRAARCRRAVLELDLAEPRRPRRSSVADARRAAARSRRCAPTRLDVAPARRRRARRPLPAVTRCSGAMHLEEARAPSGSIARRAARRDAHDQQPRASTSKSAGAQEDAVSPKELEHRLPRPAPDASRRAAPSLDRRRPSAAMSSSSTLPAPITTAVSGSSASMTGKPGLLAQQRRRGCAAARRRRRARCPCRRCRPRARAACARARCAPPRRSG